MDALATAAAALVRGETVYLGDAGVVVLEGHLESEERAVRAKQAHAEGLRRVPRPDGLAEWRIRADFVATRVADGAVRSRLGRTLKPPRGRQRFATALARHPEVKRDFRAFREAALREWLEAWLREP
ncbi:MAG: hypothetical protein AAGH15_15600 [Myxococcota bacterium]